MDELIQDRIGEDRIHSLVMESLEDCRRIQPSWLTKRAKALDILLVLDKTYGCLASHVYLQSELCNKQEMYTHARSWCRITSNA